MKTSKLILPSIIILLTGCSSIGPHQIFVDRSRYADVVQETNYQQILQNIVLIRYIEPPQFMKITGITSAYTLEKSTSGLAGTYLNFLWANAAPTSTKSTNLNPYITFRDSPTITYSPVDDSETTDQMMSPIKLEYLSLLYFGGIHQSKLLFKLTMQSINNVLNAPSASNMKIIALPTYGKFFTFLDVLEDLIRIHAVDIGPKKIGNIYSIIIKFKQPYVHSPQAQLIKNILKVPQNYDEIILSDTEVPHPAPNILPVVTRTIFGILTFLSYSVEVPEADVKAHYVYSYYYPNGQPFNWHKLMRGIMTIRSSDKKPKDAFVKVYVHNHWFYISNSDLNSKLTFTLVTRLITIVAGQRRDEIPNPNPVLTVTANR